MKERKKKENYKKFKKETSTESVGKTERKKKERMR